MSPSGTVGALLAAGAGSRFAGSTHKLLAEVAGRPVAAWSLEALSQAAPRGRFVPVVISGKAGLGELVPNGVLEVPNPNWAQGQATSLHTAVRVARYLNAEHLVVGLADQPFVPAQAWVDVAVAPTTAPVVAATFDGLRRPPLRFHRSVWGDLPTEGDEGARVLLARGNVEVAEIACEGNPVDIDTDGDLQPWT
jgi:CTP:molybdopterin cytidylyltransferase MocA